MILLCLLCLDPSPQRVFCPLYIGRRFRASQDMRELPSPQIVMIDSILTHEISGFLQRPGSLSVNCHRIQIKNQQDILLINCIFGVECDVRLDRATWQLNRRLKLTQKPTERV